MGQIAVIRANRATSPRTSQSPGPTAHARFSGGAVFSRGILVLQPIYHDGVIVREFGWSSSAIPLEIFTIAGVRYKNLSVCHCGRHKTGEQTQAVGYIRFCVGTLAAP